MLERRRSPPGVLLVENDGLSGEEPRHAFNAYKHGREIAEKYCCGQCCGPAAGLGLGEAMQEDDPKKALAALESACASGVRDSSGVGEACAMMGTGTKQGLRRRRQRDLRKATRRRRMMIAARASPAVMGSCDSYGDMIKDSYPARALGAWRMACESDDGDACAPLAEAYEKWAARPCGGAVGRSCAAGGRRYFCLFATAEAEAGKSAVLWHRTPGSRRRQKTNIRHGAKPVLMLAALHIIGFLVFGLLIGAAGRSLVARRRPRTERGWASSMLWGVCGALLGGFFGDAGGLYRDGDQAAFVLAMLGAFAFVGGSLGVAALRRARLERAA